MTENRLALETSPYLLLHAHNPVDWYPWGEEALGRARELGRPIFLSVGYSTCYWCHVMERESFSDAATAELMNRRFVNVKLDREERPDLDEVYMTATQILTGQGGWPNSVFLTPDLKPFYAGTYFPPEDRYGRPGFPSLLRGLAEAWEGRRDEVEAQAEEVATAMRRYLEERAQAGSAPPPASVRDAAVSGLMRRFDEEFGGFGGAPKFPTPSNLFLLHEVTGAVAEKVPGTAPGEAAGMLAATLDQMARGGLYDQLGGGFHRYATDRAWRVPHFEKMLYDNALLLELYARHHAATGDPEARRVAVETAAFLEREMTLPEGGFASAIDAETDGREGAYYVWTRTELEQVLGDEDFTFLASLYGFEGPPFFEDDSYVLHLPVPLDEQARRRRRRRDELLAEIEPLRQRLLAARGERKRPLTDDKVLTDWNGMTVAALATAGRLLGEPAWVRRAGRAADFVLAALRPAGRLLHAWRGGEAKVPGMLADYVWMVRGLLALAAAEAEEDGEAAGRRLARAAELAAEQRRHLGDPAGGYFNAEERPDLLLRSKEVFDGATPAANAMAVLNALDLAAATGDESWLADARATLAAAAPLVEQFPDGARMMTLAAGRWHERGHAPAGEARTPAADGAGKAVTAGDALAGEAEAVVRVDLELGEAAPAAAGDDAGWRRFRLRLTVADGWHVQAHRVGDEALVATRLAAEAARLRQVEYPPGEALAAGGEATPVYRGEAEIRGAVRPDGASAALLLTYQPCDDQRCLPPVERRLVLSDLVLSGADAG